jgi:myo-inositol 2-dehydrogenase/D-chiro-inositol 1-dehydrogenase
VDALLEEAEALVIASPTPTHVGLLRLAMSAGVPVFCEKPVASALSEVEELAALARQTSSPVQIGFHYRFDPALRDLLDRLRPVSGPRYLRVHSTTEFAPSQGYLAAAGGLVADKLIHELDMIRWMSGSEVVRVAALPGRDSADGSEPMTAALTMELADGGLATVWGGYRSVAGFDLTVEVETPEVVLVAGNRRVVSQESRTVPPSTVTDFRDRFAEAYQAEIQAFIEVARGGMESPCTMDEALRTHRLVSFTQAALRAGRVVDATGDAGDPQGPEA